MLRMSTPAFVKSRVVACVSHAPLRYCMLALVEMGAPSITKLVPNDDVAYWPPLCAASRRLMVLGAVSDGFWALPPGSSSRMSVKLDG